MVTTDQAIALDPAQALAMVAYMVGWHQVDGPSNVVNQALAQAYQATVKP